MLTANKLLRLNTWSSGLQRKTKARRLQLRDDAQCVGVSAVDHGRENFTHRPRQSCQQIHPVQQHLSVPSLVRLEALVHHLA
jgi:hypothetical protein